jgi:hypothetical protein
VENENPIAYFKYNWQDFASTAFVSQTLNIRAYMHMHILPIVFFEFVTAAYRKIGLDM